MSRSMSGRGEDSPATGELCASHTVLPDAAFLAVENADPKTLQLCAQALRALEYAIDCESRDPALADLQVLAVMPDPSVRRLRVWLRGPEDLSREQRELVLERLNAARGFLRTRVAEAIHRKRTPELCFELLAGGSRSECEDT